MVKQLIRSAKRKYREHKLSQNLIREVNEVSGKQFRLKSVFKTTDEPFVDARIERDGDQLTIICQKYRGYVQLYHVVKKLEAYAYWLTLCSPDVKYMTVNCSDGENFSKARFTPSSRFPEFIPIVDPHFFQHRGFIKQAAQGKEAPSWRDRSDEIVWRGGYNGRGWRSYLPNDPFNPAIVQRLRMHMILKDVAGTDIGFIRRISSDPSFLREGDINGIFKSPLPEKNWLTAKYAIDIDGYTNTWSNLLVRMLYGCCVLKVESQFGYRQWYYDDIKAWEHYVPVKADMSDFAEKIDWVRSNQLEAEKIAARGQAFARTLTFESQARRSAQIIEANAEH